MITNLNKAQQERLQSAIEALDQGHLTDAVQVLVSLSFEANNNPEVFYRLGTAYHHSGQLERAIAALEHCLGLHPAHTNAAIALSVIYNDVGEYERAAKIFHQAEEALQQPNKSSVVVPSNDVNQMFSLRHQDMAMMYLTHHRPEEAIREAELAAQLTPRDPQARLVLSRTLAQKGLYQRAIDELLRIKRENPQFLPARINLGLLYHAQGQIAEALGEWERVLALDPNHEEAQRLYKMASTSTH